MHRMCQIFLGNVSVWSDKLQQKSKDKSVNLLDEIHLLSNSLQDSIFYFCTAVEISLIIPRHLVILWFPQSNKNTKILFMLTKRRRKITCLIFYEWQNGFVHNLCWRLLTKNGMNREKIRHQMMYYFWPWFHL